MLLIGVLKTSECKDQLLGLVHFEAKSKIKNLFRAELSWYVPVVLATEETETGGLFDLINLRPAWTI